ncbi:MAG: hypothetical protein IKT58_03320 [Oscillospiraceae bacterium]|nr:hypothetical protein [Oscillospiraceae bacterium]
MQKKLPLDFLLRFCRDMIPKNGEDSYCYCFCDTAGLLGVFDGCGGAGARKHEYYSDKTEAYMASRICAGAVYDSFCKTFPREISANEFVEQILVPDALNCLRAYAPPKENNGVQIMGSMVRTLPTTAAIALVQDGGREDLLVSAIWAGDSRVYLLDGQGLAQLTEDDTTVPDPMLTLYEDGILKNIFCSDRKVRVNCRSFRVKPPFVLLSATDGCFGYVSTPMEFEGILLGTLLNAQSPKDWEEKMAGLIGKCAGDDHTLCLASFGYGDFAKLRSSMKNRYDYIVQAYLNTVNDLPVEDRQSRFVLWEKYRGEYMRYQKDGRM